MMKLVLGGFVVSAVLLAGGDDAAIKKERAKFKGTWKITRFETSKGEEDKGKDITLTFGDDGSLEMRKGNESKKGSYKVRPDAKPKEIDLHAEDEKDVGRGIYVFEKDKIKLCFTDGKDTERPKEFAIKDGSRTIIVTLERAK